MKHFYLCFLFFLFLGIAGFSQKTDYLAFTIDSTLRVNANAVVRIYQREVSVSSAKKMSIHTKQVVTVFNESGQSAIAGQIYYDDDMRIVDLEAVVYDALGNELKTIKERDFKDRSIVPNGTLYSDSRYKILDHKPLSYPYTISIIYTQKTSNTTLPPFYFISDRNTAVEKAEMILNYNIDEMRVNFKEKNFLEYAIDKKETASGIMYTATNLLPIQYEAYGPPLSQVVPKLLMSSDSFYFSGHVGTAKNWKSLGDWMYRDILKGRDELPAETVRKMNELTAGTTDPVEKAKIIYHYVQQNTRYISVQVGIGGIQPASAEEVDKLKYGDCKGLTNYTHALLKSVGIPSYYTVVESGSVLVDLESDFASLHQGDHVILAISIDDELYWVDCTSNSNPFNYLGDFTDNRRVLMVTPEGGKLIKTPAYLDQENSQKIIADIFLKADRNMTAKVRISSKGATYDGRWGLTTISSKKIKKYYKNRWDNIHNLEIDDYQFENNKAIPIFEEHLDISAPEYLTQAGNYLFFQLSSLSKNDFVPPRYEDRKSSFQISRGFLYEDQITVHLPEGYAVESLPEKVALDTEFGHYRATLAVKNNATLVYTKNFFVKAGKYPKEKYVAFREFREQIAQNENRKILLIKTN